MGQYGRPPLATAGFLVKYTYGTYALLYRALRTLNVYEVQNWKPKH